MFARNTKLLEFEGSSNQKLLEVTNFRIELSDMRFDSLSNSIKKFRYSNLDCKS